MKIQNEKCTHKYKLQSPISVNEEEEKLPGFAAQVPQAANIALISPKFLYKPVFLNVVDHIFSLFPGMVYGFFAQRIDGTYRFTRIFFIGHPSGKFLRK